MAYGKHMVYREPRPLIERGERTVLVGPERLG